MTIESVAQKICAVEGCDKKKHGYIYCAKHYYKYKTYGDPLGGRRGASPGAPMKWIQDNKDYDGDDCLKWPFEITRHGYGCVKQNGKKRVASRVMCEVAHGIHPDDKMEACHSCGNGHLACMNPSHLSWKTRTGNVRDAMDHGTWKHGDMDPNAKLDERKVREIRDLARSQTHSQIAKWYGITKNQVYKVVSKRQWAWVD